MIQTKLAVIWWMITYSLQLGVLQQLTVVAQDGKSILSLILVLGLLRL